MPSGRNQSRCVAAFIFDGCVYNSFMVRWMQKLNEELKKMELTFRETIADMTRSDAVDKDMLELMVASSQLLPQSFINEVRILLCES